MRPERLYLSDISEAAESIARFVSGHTQESFAANELVQSAVLQKLIVIGEAAAHLDEGVRRRAPTVPWQKVVAFRNFAVHAYFSVDWSIVWVTATIDVPSLHREISRLLLASEDE